MNVPIDHDLVDSANRGTWSCLTDKSDRSPCVEVAGRFVGCTRALEVFIGPRIDPMKYPPSMLEGVFAASATAVLERC